MQLTAKGKSGLLRRRSGRVWEHRHRLHQWGQFARRASGRPARSICAARCSSRSATRWTFSKGAPPTLTVCNTDSLGEQTQREFFDARVVKALNTVNCDVMVNPSCVPGEHELFICGNDAGAKSEVSRDGSANGSAGSPGASSTWGIFPTRAGREIFYLALWVRMWGLLGTPHFKHPHRSGERKRSANWNLFLETGSGVRLIPRSAQRPTS